VAITGVAVVLSLALTLVRHEVAHVVGVMAVGGRVTGWELWPAWGTLAQVEALAPLRLGPLSYTMPLALPYVLDYALMLGSVRLARLARDAGFREALFQHCLFFAGGDVLLNCAAGFIGHNDWNRLLGGLGVWEYPVLLGVVAVTVWLMTTQKVTWVKAQARLRREH
jgi:hypothetical protein